MHYSYKTKDVCASGIEFDVENDKMENIIFKGGCNGNLKGIGVLVEGLQPEVAMEKLKGITCGRRSTSCPDQLSVAISQYLSGAE